MAGTIFYFLVIVGVLVGIGLITAIIKMYNKALQGQAMVRTGLGGTKVSFSGIFVVPVIHKLEVMDITLKTIVIARTGKEGLICQDNMRADIKVTFFVRVNQTIEDVKQVAQSIGAERASNQSALELLFDAKFSEALKTVGKNFEFVELYSARDRFKQEILNIIGTDLNGYVLDDCAIDYLEQTPRTELDENNILDAEGIKKIIDLTSNQKMQANQIERERDKTLTKQNVEAKETILELEKQQAEAEAKQRREIDSIRYREEAEADKIREEERLKSRKAKIRTDEELEVAEQNKEREVIVAQKSKERTDAVESEKVDRARLLELTDKERFVEIARIEKEKAVEEERKNIQDVIRERVTIEKTVVEEQERMKDIEAMAEADRTKKVAITLAEKDAEEALVKMIKDAEAKKAAAEHLAKQQLIDAQSEENAAIHRAQAKKTLAEALAAEAAAIGLSEAQVMEAKAAASEKEGDAAAAVIEAKAEAEAVGIKKKGLAQAEADEQIGLASARVTEAQSEADEKKGLVEAKVMSEKFAADAKGVEAKAKAMKALDGVGKDHEEFKLQLELNKELGLATVAMQKEIAMAQASVIAEALKAANIEIVGGETMFFEQIMGSITRGKTVDKMLSNSEVLSQVKDTFLSSATGDSFKEKLQNFIGQFGLSSDNIKDMSVANLLLQMSKSADKGDKTAIDRLGDLARTLGIQDTRISDLNL